MERPIANERLASPQTIFRNLVLVASGLFGLCFVVGTMPAFSLIGSLRAPMLLAAAILWGAWYVAKSASAHRSARRRIRSSQGPGGQLIQKATLRGFNREANREANESESVDLVEAEEKFTRGERHYAGGR